MDVFVCFYVVSSNTRDIWTTRLELRNIYITIRVIIIVLCGKFIAFGATSRVRVQWRARSIRRQGSSFLISECWKVEVEVAGYADKRWRRCPTPAYTVDGDNWCLTSMPNTNVKYKLPLTFLLPFSAAISSSNIKDLKVGVRAESIQWVALSRWGICLRKRTP